MRTETACTCGMVIRGRIEAHQASAFHQHADRIKKLMAVPCVRLSDIASRVGITRQRLDQIIKQMKFRPGRDRQEMCSLESAKLDLAKRPLMVRFLRDCKLPVAFVPRKTFGFSRSRVKVNGVMCRLRMISRSSNSPDIFQIVRPRLLPDEKFVICLLPTQQWMVFPAERFMETQFKLEPNGNWGAKTYRHDFKSFLEAWHLIGQNKTVDIP